MRKHRVQKNMKDVNIFIAIMVLATAILFSSCSAAKHPGESQTPATNSAETTMGPSDATENDQEFGEDGTNGTSVDNGEKVKELDAIEDMQLGALRLDMPKAEVERVMKSELADSVTREEYGMETEVQTYKDGTVINLLSGKIYSISVKTPGYATPRGLNTGDTEETLKKLYGEPSAVEGGKWIYSSRGYDMFFVTVKNGVVEEIMISQVL